MDNQAAVRETLLAIEQARKKLLQPKLTGLGLTLGQGQPRILSSLLQNEEVTQKELADACRLDATTLSRTLDHMEKADLLLRRRDPDCRRSFRIVLTEKGREVALRVREAFRSADQSIWQGFDEEEMQTLLAGLQKVLRNLDQACSGEK